MNDKDILLKLIDELGIKNVASFSKELGYKNPNAVYSVIRDTQHKRPIGEALITKILKRFPQVNENFLRGLENSPLKKKPEKLNKEVYTLNDLPGIMVENTKKLDEIKTLLVQILNHLKS